MAGRYTPPLLAGVIGVVSGIWIFEPLIRSSVHPEKPPILVPSDEEATKLPTYGLPSYSNEKKEGHGKDRPAEGLEGVPPVSGEMKRE